MRRQFLGLVLFGLLPFVGGCSSGYGCGASVDPAVVVTVTDAETKAPAAEGAVGTVRDGDYSETLGVYSRTYVEADSFGGIPLSLGGAWGRPGTYTVRVEKDGYEPWEATGVRVRQDVCQFSGSRLEAELKRKE